MTSIFSRPATVKVASMTIGEWNWTGQGWYEGKVIIYCRRRYPRPSRKLVYEIHLAPSGWSLVAPNTLIEVEA